MPLDMHGEEQHHSCLSPAKNAQPESNHVKNIQAEVYSTKELPCTPQKCHGLEQQEKRNRSKLKMTKET